MKQLLATYMLAFAVVRRPYSDSDMLRHLINCHIIIIISSSKTIITLVLSPLTRSSQETGWVYSNKKNAAPGART